ncbi:molybdenum cofactor biosynthesis protein MoaE [Rhodohalobacter sp.]|uniref:molybdopterin synthase catalytic subunit n=1 Tax=Rhodohalobacter sp. TaxID=1974210 RepID=UPI002ACECE3F|nr:molybdenum cofactor biosynthesis protein MoaE [Rhodohalobacter sp.]MDZ7756824.1 molybdenum cofactor biosynthesis protein MoaE [Rhodohalobacter sp.]
MQELKTETLWILISDHLPDVSEAGTFVEHPECGAVNIFTGLTRNHHDGKTVTGLYYDCYEEMALKEAQKLLDEITQKYKLSKAVLFHKTGDAPVGEISLITALSAPHRKPVLDATDELINRLKEELPIWKREEFEDETLWKEEQIIRKESKTAN